MASFNIKTGSIPKQDFVFVKSNSFAVRTREKGLRTYSLKTAIKDLEVLSETIEKIVFKIILKDNENFTAEAKPQVFEKIRDAYDKGKGSEKKYVLNEKTQKQVRTHGIINLIIFGLFAWGVFWFFTNVSFPNSKNKNPLEKYKDDAKSYCIVRANFQLKAPTTAKPNYHAPVIIKDGQFIVKSHVDAQNSFGAMIRTPFTCILERQGDGWKTIEFQYE